MIIKKSQSHSDFKRVKPLSSGRGDVVLIQAFARVIKVPQFGALILWIPIMRCRAERENALLRAAFLFIPPAAAKGCIETAGIERAGASE